MEANRLWVLGDWGPRPPFPLSFFFSFILGRSVNATNTFSFSNLKRTDSRVLALKSLEFIIHVQIQWFWGPNRGPPPARQTLCHWAMPLAPINHILTAKSNNRIVHKRYVYETFPLR
jgi:hypothetical protein